MSKLQSRDKHLLLTILLVAVQFGVMLLFIQLLGELHGLISTVIMLIVQLSFLQIRVMAMERELQLSRKTTDNTSSNIAEKTV